MHKILHITPHLGGGVGSVLLKYLEKVKGTGDRSHKVISLEYANEKAKLASKAIGISLEDKMSSDHSGMLTAISQADVVLIHWWNHPLLYDFLVRESLPPARIIFWSHISGFSPPCVFNQPSLNYPDLFVFTSPLSLEVAEVKNLREERQKALRVVWSTGGIEHTASVMPKPHARFNIGYIGTVDYGKMHSHFLKMSSMVKIPGAQFIVCGGPSEKQIQKESMQYGKGERFVFTGQIKDVSNYLSEFDIFGYPLAPYHFGTCEQSLGESMAAGVPPVVLANRTERYIVEDGVTGIIAADEECYVRALEGLYRNPDLRQRLSDNARKAAMQRYSLDLMITLWENIYNETLRLPKIERQWTGKHRGQNVSPANLFLESLGTHGKEFLCSLNAHDENDKEATKDDIRKLYESSHLWRSSTRGTANHYHYFFPDDKALKCWSDLTCIDCNDSDNVFEDLNQTKKKIE